MVSAHPEFPSDRSKAMRKHKLIVEQLDVSSFIPINVSNDALFAQVVPESEGCGGGGPTTTFVTFYYTDCAGRTIGGAWGTC
jgi:hypothetical protein